MGKEDVYTIGNQLCACTGECDGSGAVVALPQDLRKQGIEVLGLPVDETAEIMACIYAPPSASNTAINRVCFLLCAKRGLSLRIPPEGLYLPTDIVQA